MLNDLVNHWLFIGVKSQVLHSRHRIIIIIIIIIIINFTWQILLVNISVDLERTNQQTIKFSPIDSGEHLNMELGRFICSLTSRLPIAS